MASDAADALAKTYARNKKLLSLRSITNGLQQTGLLVAYTGRIWDFPGTRIGKRCSARK